MPKRLFRLFRLMIWVSLFCILQMQSSIVHGETKTLDVVLDESYPPYIFYDETGQPQGILVDQWMLFEEKTGIEVRLHPMLWQDAQLAMQRGEYDVIDTIFYSESRDKEYDFAGVYETIETSIFFHKSISGITEISSLKGFSVGVKAGDYAYEKLLEAGVEDIKVYNSYEEIVKAASLGSLKIFIIDLPPGLYYLNKYNIYQDFHYTEPVYQEGFHRAVLEGNQATLDLIQEGFAQLPQTQLDAIHTKWFGNHIVGSERLKDFFLVMGILALVIIIVFGWNSVLRRRVKMHTASLSETLQTLKAEQAKLEALITSMPDLIFILDKDGKVQESLSQKTRDDDQLDPNRIVYKNISEVFEPEAALQLKQGIETALLEGQSEDIEVQIDTEHNGKQYFEARFARLSDNKILGIVRNTTEKVLSIQKIMNLSIIDKLTNVYNRNFFEKAVKEWKNPEKDGIGLFMVDIDGLKLVNDTLGHDVGDQYLRIIAKTINRVFTEPEFVARIGGDEFAVAVRGWDEDRMLLAKNQLIDEVRALNEKGYPIPFSISIGFALATPSCNTALAMMKCADDYMYRQKLFHRQSERSKTIDTLSAMLSERDFLTQGHSRRMSSLIKKIACKVNFPDSQMPAIELFADFHDIGKIGISDVILFKQDKLTDEEFVDMKRHSEIGFRIAESSPDLNGISEWVYKHHENWDGTGYPFGAKGEEIPLACRILTIVDAYDAMTNDRPYRKAMSRQAAIVELKRCAGTQFDPTLVEIFLDILLNEEEA